MNKTLDYQLATLLNKLIKSNIGVEIKEETLKVLLETKRKSVNVPKELSTAVKSTVKHFR